MPTYPSITSQGNILTQNILEKIALDEAASQSAADYGVSSKDVLREQIQFEWGVFQNNYKNFIERIHRSDDNKKTGITRNHLISPFLSSLGYEIRLESRAEVINDRSYPISHRDTRAADLLTKQSYLQFDLEQMVADNLYANFSLMYRLLPITRMPREVSAGAHSIIEANHQDGLVSGSRIRANFSRAVESAILKLGKGLLADPRNVHPHTYGSPDKAKDYYALLLKMIYRTLFLMVIEER